MAAGRETWLSCLPHGRIAQTVQERDSSRMPGGSPIAHPSAPAAVLKRSVSTNPQVAMHSSIPFSGLGAGLARPLLHRIGLDRAVRAVRRNSADLRPLRFSGTVQGAHRRGLHLRWQMSISQLKLSEKSGESTYFARACEAAGIAGPPLHSLNASQPYEREPDLATGENKANTHRVRPCSSTAPAQPRINVADR